MSARVQAKRFWPFYNFGFFWKKVAVKTKVRFTHYWEWNGCAHRACIATWLGQPFYSTCVLPDEPRVEYYNSTRDSCVILKLRGRAEHCWGCWEMSSRLSIFHPIKVQDGNKKSSWFLACSIVWLDYYCPSCRPQWTLTFWVNETFLDGYQLNPMSNDLTKIEPVSKGLKWKQKTMLYNLANYR